MKTFIILIIAVVLIAGGYYFYTHKTQTPEVKPVTDHTTDKVDVATIYDSDLKMPLDTVTVDCIAVNNFAYASDTDQKLIEAYVTGTSTKTSSAVKKTITADASQITTFLNGGQWTDHADQMDANGKLACQLSSIRNLARVSIAKAKMSAIDKKTADTQATVKKVLDIAQKMEDNAQSTLGYLTALGIKNEAINMLAALKKSKIIKSASFQPLLKNYADNSSGLKRAFKYEYTRSAKMIDDLALKNHGPYADVLGQDFFAEFDKKRTAYNFQPNNTKLLFHNVYKSYVENVDKSCGSEYSTPIEKIDGKDTTIENYYGKMIFSISTPELNSINNTRCEVETKFTAL